MLGDSNHLLWSDETFWPTCKYVWRTSNIVYYAEDAIATVKHGDGIMMLRESKDACLTFRFLFA